MASTTPNIGLTLPAGTEKRSRAIWNDNFTIIDTKIGAVGNTSLQAQVTALNSQLGKYVDLGEITNLDISTRTANTVYHFTFGANIASNPFSAKSGHGYLYVNDATSYGSQILYSDGGIKVRKLSSGVYGTWQNLITL